MTPVFNARNVIDIKRETEIKPRRANVFAAFSLFGLRNAGTPLEIASTPVSALHPEENARAKRNTSAIPAIEPCSVIVQFALSALSSFPCADLTTAQIVTNAMLAMKKYAGIAKINPESRKPLRFITVMRIISAKATTIP